MIYSEDCLLNDFDSASAAAAEAADYAFELFDCWIYLERRWCVEIIVEVGGASFLEER